MTPRTGLKLYLLGGLSILSLILAALVFADVIATENSVSVGFQYLFVGVVLGALFLYFGGFRKLRSQLGIVGRLTSTRRATVSKGRGSEQLTQNPQQPIESLGGRRVLVDEPVVGADSQEPNRPGSGMLTPFVAAGRESSVRWNTADEVIAAIKQHEGELIDRLIHEGLLTIEGPITERDVHVMAWVALNTIELSDNLLNGVSDQTRAQISLPVGDLPHAELPK